MGICKALSSDKGSQLSEAFTIGPLHTDTFIVSFNISLLTITILGFTTCQSVLVLYTTTNFESESPLCHSSGVNDTKGTITIISKIAVDFFQTSLF